MYRKFTHIPKLLKGLSIIALLQFFVFAAFAQQITIAGKVTSEKNEALPGVSVQLKNATGILRSVTTNQNGEFTIVGDGNSTITFSYVGFTAQTIHVNNRSTVKCHTDRIFKFIR